MYHVRVGVPPSSPPHPSSAIGVTVRRTLIAERLRRERPRAVRDRDVRSGDISAPFVRAPSFPDAGARLPRRVHRGPSPAGFNSQYLSPFRGRTETQLPAVARDLRPFPPDLHGSRHVVRARSVEWMTRPERIVMSTVTAEVAPSIARPPRTRARHHEAPVIHLQCACSPGLRQPAWISECPNCGATLA